MAEWERRSPSTTRAGDDASEREADPSSLFARALQHRIVQRKVASAGDEKAGAPKPPAPSGGDEPLGQELAALEGGDEDEDGGVEQQAARGVAGSGGPLPHGDQIQRAFGRHDVSGVQAHSDDQAGGAAQAIGAEAYATGDHVAFDGAPDLHTAAHEAAHVVQQRGGVQLKGGIDGGDDPHERHADDVADQVVSGKSAEALLDRYAGGAGPAGGQVQRLASTAGDMRAAGASGPRLGPKRKYRAIVEAVAAYHAAPAPQKKAKLQAILAACTAWLGKNDNGKDKKQKLAAVLKLQNQALGELDRWGTETDDRAPAANPTLKELKDREGAPLQQAYEKTDKPLFAADPTAADVQQGALGDCFLLAAASSLAEREPARIREMMRESGDTVTVRLFKEAGPEFVKVEKSIPKVTKASGEKVDPYAKNFLWVQMLEKAYAVGGGAYKKIEGGKGSAAFFALTGKVDDTILRPGTNEEELRARLGPVPWPQKLEAPAEGFDFGDSDAEAVEADKLAKRALYTEHFGAHAATWQAFIETETNHAQLKNLSTLESIQEALAGGGLAAEVSAVVMSYLEAQHVFPGKLGSGKYSSTQLGVYKKIGAAIGGGKIVVGGTRADIPGGGGDRSENGEKKVAGMLGGHQYSVLGVEEKDGLRYVKVRNPWGHYARGYRAAEEGGGLEAFADEDNKNGVFLIELSDLTDNFEDMDVTS